MSGSTAIASHQHSGLLVDPGEAAALAESLLALIADAPLRVRLGRAALELVQAQSRRRTGSIASCIFIVCCLTSSTATRGPVNGILRTHDELRALLLRSRNARRTRLVGIDGPGGSGKSTLARALARDLFTIVHGDDFYRPSHERYSGTRAERAIAADFDLERLESQVLAPLSRDQHAQYQRYDWSSDRLGSWVDVAPGGVVVVEGVYTTKSTLAAYYDLRVWVECSRATRLRRGLARDGEHALAAWRGWMDQEDQYALTEQPSSRAHLVVCGEDRTGVDPAINVCVIAEPVRGMS